LDRYFNSIIESSVVGIRKPDPALYAMGVKALSLPAEEILVIGDSYRKDICPAGSIGCKTIWIKGLVWEEERTSEIIPSATIKSLDELLTILT
ncbi:MAG: HAD family hydrolase, partial [Bacteroidaceae bacterium]|nr:HAD family hydrolase [Bacteroidaceae bacterium]